MTKYVTSGMEKLHGEHFPVQLEKLIVLRYSRSMSEANAGRMRAGPPAERFKLEKLIEAEEIRELLHKSWDLTDEAFDELVDDLGYRAAKLVLRAKAVAGDVKALDLYLRLAKEAKRERQARKRPEQRNVTPPQFLSAGRTSDPDSSE